MMSQQAPDEPASCSGSGGRSLPRACSAYSDIIHRKSSSVLVQGAPRIWSLRSHAEEVQIVSKSARRRHRIVARTYVPVKMRVYSEDGHLQPFTAVPNAQ